MVRAAANRTHEARTSIAALNDLLGQLTPVVATLEPLRAEYVLADRLADIACGRSTANTLSMELERTSSLAASRRSLPQPTPACGP